MAAVSARRTPTTNGTNGQTTNGFRSANGFSSPTPSSPRTPKGFTNGLSVGGKRVNSANYSGIGERSHGNQKLPFVEDTALTLKRKSMSELGAGVYQSIEDTSFINLVEWVRQERITTLPHKGSTWDTVLIRALYFAEHLNRFEVAVQGLASGSNAAAQLGYGHARLLLELGHENSGALDKAFGFLYKCSLTVSSLLDRSEFLSVTSEVREQLCMLYTDLLTLVVQVAVRFYKTVHGMTTGSASLDIYELLGSTIDTFQSRRGKIGDAIWSYQIESEGIDADETLPIEVLSKWLAPQDRVLSMLGTDHTTFAESQAEFTCLWFQDELARFIKSNNECLLLNAAPGCGKTTLAAWITNRLQRSVGRKSYSTVFCSIGSVQSQADTMNVVKTLLYQLLNIRIGNLGLYHALVRAYEHARQTADPKAYEEHLWTALVDALQHPLEHSNDTVMIIDGLDEIQGGQPAAQALLEKLSRTVGRAKRTKMIGLATSLSLPSGARGVQRAISPEDTRDDMHAVATRSLLHSHHFTSRPGREQESIIATINDTAKGNFLWTSLVCELLKMEKSPESFTKTLQTLKSAPVNDLVSRLLSALQPTNEAALLLSWLTTAARPLTFDELEDLFAIDVEKTTRSDRRTNVHDLVQFIRPMVSIHSDVVRIRHAVVHKTLQTLFDQGKVPVPVKDRQMDTLLRMLTYTKVTLHDKGEPTLDSTDKALPARLFSQHHLLEYVVRYWPYHLRQTTVFPSGSNEPKATPELQKAFPESTTMPVLEWLCWDDQFPGAQEVELHVLVGRLRKTIFGENHPTVLQSYINTATYYEPMGNDREASKYYFHATVIGQVVLNPFHPITLECGNRFLGLTEPMTTTSRTEIMTQRERVLTILITAYERQFGVTSELVVDTRQLLVQLYMMIHEEDRATELMRIIHGATVEKHGRDSDLARDMSDHLRVQLGKGHRREDLKSHDSLFGTDDEEEEEDDAATFDIGRVAILLREAETHASQKRTLEAEQIYVELWQKLSERCRNTLSLEWHESKIDTVNTYAKFLRTQKRETETSAMLTCLAQEYEHHELSYSENIISRLIESAQTLKSVGHYNAALSIWRQASSYYKSTKKEDSRSFTQIEEEIAVTSSEVLKHATSGSTATEKTSTTSESSLAEVFHSMITNSTKTLDKATITLAKQLAVQYIQQRRWSEAVSVIHLTLGRSWTTFFAASLHNVSMTSTFLQESVELVERLADCYLQQRLIENVIDIYTRLFRAALTSPQQHKDLLDKSRTLLVSFYDKHGYPDKAISVYQEILAVYRRVHGPGHDLTIQTLYELGSRCRAHARTHPYWTEYYQQITIALNKESEVHANAMEATILVANSYWEERRYTDAVTVFTVLWNTFVAKTKQYKHFSDATFVQDLYNRYYQCLEATQTDWETLYRVTKQYRETCLKSFGASSAITISATVAMARITQSNEKHAEEAISWFEDLSKSSSTSSSKEESSSVRQTLATLYKRRITTQSSVSSETLTRAASIYQEQLVESRSQYGYAHSLTLSSLRELVMLQSRQSKTDVAIKEIHTAVAEIVTKETSDEKMLECAMSIAQTFQSCQQVQQCTELVQELHRQLVAKETRKSSKFSFDLTSSSNSAALVFLAGLEFHIRSNMSLTLSDFLSDIIAEQIYYEQFRRVMKARSGLDKILMTAAPLRYFLLHRQREDLVRSLEEQIVHLFIQRDTADLKLLSQGSPRIFIVGILEHLGSRKTANFVRAVILASNHSLSRLIDNNKFAEAYDVANIAFIYAQYHKGYHGPRAISRGFELASYLDGRGENRCPEEGLRKKLLQLSNSIIKEILKICRDQKINMAQVQLAELNQLIALLGEQGDYETLESLLASLWNTRDAQRSWPTQVLLNLGQRLICARYLAGHAIKAVRLCEDIAYNLRRVHGARHPATLEAYGLLAQLYTSVGQENQKAAEKDKSAASIATDYFKRAIFVHEDVLRWLIAGSSDDASSEGEDDEDTAALILREHGVMIDEDNDGRPDEDQVDKGKLAKQHLRLLKLAFQRLGSWPKQYSQYENLNASVFRVFGSQLGGMEGVEKWQAKGFGAGKAESNEGAFVGVSVWEILPTELRRELEAEEDERL